jgi:hypothetical protein
MEDGLREQMKTIGSGDAFVFQDGIVVPGIWHKADKKSQMTFTDKAGNPLSLNRGQTWITALAPEKDVSWQ